MCPLQRVSFALLILAVSASPALAQDDPVVNDLHERVVKFFEDVSQKDNVSRGFQELLEGGPLEKNESVQSLGGRVERFDETYGAMLESERISFKRIGKDLVLMKYLYKAERFPVVWHFSFYRPPTPNRDNQDWFVISVSFDTNLKLLAVTQP